MKCFKNTLKSKIIFILIIILCFYSPAVYASTPETSELKDVLKTLYINVVPDKILDKDSPAEIIKEINDPYLQYFNYDEYLNYIKNINKNYTCLGISFDIVTEGIKVNGFTGNSSAYESGIRESDIIIEINGHNLSSLNFSGINDLVNGKVGTLLTLKVLRNDNILNYIAIRKPEYVPTVISNVVDNHIGYIDINSFSEKTADEFKNELYSLDKYNVDSYIIDLRNNPGGYLYSVLDIAGYFIGNKSAMVTLDRINKATTYYAVKQSRIVDKPVIVLIDNNTCSSAEVLAAALKEYNTALLIGQNTYGKGTEQGFVFLSTGNVVKLTVRKLLTPSKNFIDKAGISPDYDSGECDPLLTSELLLGKANNIFTGNYLISYFDNHKYEIDLEKARLPKFWSAFNKFFKQTHSNKGTYIADIKGKWITLSADYNSAPYSYLYPTYRALPVLSNVSPESKFAVSFNFDVGYTSISNKNIELINANTGERSELEFSGNGKPKTIQVNTSKPLLTGQSYYLVIHDNIISKGGKDMENGFICPINIK